MTLPLVIFPEPLRSIALALPWASYLQTPADIWLGQRTGSGLVSGLVLQVLWIAVLLAVCQAVLGAATRKVVVQGG
jgi:ABC-2 type transport system permease protein